MLLWETDVTTVPHNHDRDWLKCLQCESSEKSAATRNIKRVAFSQRDISVVCENNQPKSATRKIFLNPCVKILIAKLDWVRNEAATSDKKNYINKSDAI